MIEEHQGRSGDASGAGRQIQEKRCTGEAIKVFDRGPVEDKQYTGTMIESCLETPSRHRRGG